jgi:choline dehydrogenase-like flavoprotein
MKPDSTPYPSAQYPAGWARPLLESEATTSTTRSILSERLQAPPDAELGPWCFFDEGEQATLVAVCDRLFPQPERERPIPIAYAIDMRLSKGEGNGWRYDALPPDGEAFQRGLRGLDEAAQVLAGTTFVALSPEQQDEVLRQVRAGTAPGEVWQAMRGDLFFEELLSEATENYYAHPLAQEEIGYAGFADAPGWNKIGLNQREAREPLPTKEGGDASQVLIEIAAAPREEIPRMVSQSLFACEDEVDAVVIGTGAGGAPILARLASAGLKVVALEAGPQWDASRDFATDEKSQSKLFWNDERLSAGADPVAFGNNNSGTGVGGSTLHYTAYTPRTQPGDLRLFSEFGVGVDWPLSYDDIEPYYSEVETFLGVSGPTPYPWGPDRSAGYALAPLPLNGAAQLMQRGCEALGIRTSPAANAALSARYYQPGVGWRAACTNRGFCQAGCSTGAKASMDVTYLPVATAKGAEIRPGCFVTQIETDASGRVSGVVYNRGGQEFRQKCKALFLCGGAIETPRLLLMNGLANSSGQVGRNFMSHPGMQIWARFDEDVRPYKGIPGALISEDTHRPRKYLQGTEFGDADFAGGYLLQSIGVMPVTYASQLARGRRMFGEEMREHMRGYNNVAGINILGDCLPYDHNFLELSDEKDGRGLPKPRIHFSNGDNEKKMSDHAEKVMRAIFAEAGARDVWSFPRNAHIIGTARMANSASEGVVDAFGRSFDIPNLFLCDNSVFPSALSVNPALTIMALALRTADKFLESAGHSA